MIGLRGGRRRPWRPADRWDAPLGAPRRPVPILADRVRTAARPTLYATRRPAQGPR